VRRACLKEEHHAERLEDMWQSSKHCDSVLCRRYHDHNQPKEHLARIPNRALRSQQTLQKVKFASDHHHSYVLSGGHGGGEREQSRAYGSQQ
jgi:hypothetical protein